MLRCRRRRPRCGPVGAVICASYPTPPTDPSRRATAPSATAVLRSEAYHAPGAAAREANPARSPLGSVIDPVDESARKAPSVASTNSRSNQQWLDPSNP
ncbi:hypothetical protein GS506_10600 [Rhodococcus hoagii]|nr:hypothetical protein [Prescottella equi]